MCSNFIMLPCVVSARNCYHTYGLKHIVLIIIFSVYVLVGTLLFYMLEDESQENIVINWRSSRHLHRSKFIQERIVAELFNNTKYLLFVNDEKASSIYNALHQIIDEYEMQILHQPPPVKWTLYDSLIYTCMLLTTVGSTMSAHITTTATKIASIVYFSAGLPLVFLVLSDLSGIIAEILSYPTKLCQLIWDAIRFWEHKTVREWKAVRRHRQQKTSIIITLILLAGWIFLGVIIILLRDPNNDITDGVYYIFTLVSTIGPLSHKPTRPDAYVGLFLYTIVGLAIVNLLIGTIHERIWRSYQVDNNEHFDFAHPPVTLGAWLTAKTMQGKQYRLLEDHQNPSTNNRGTQTSPNLVLEDYDGRSVDDCSRLLAIETYQELAPNTF